MPKQPGSDWGSITSFGGKVSSVFKGAGSGGARVRKNTNAVASVVKADSPTAWRTGSIQRNSVKQIVKDKPKPNYPTKNELGIGDKKAVKKVIARKAFKPKLTMAQERAIEKARMSESDWR